MIGRRKLYAATNDNLLAHALEPTMRWLIATALDGATITYGELARRLESQAAFSKIFTTRIGFVAGSLMNRIQAVDPTAPLINVLVVAQDDRQPSEGAGVYMANRFRNQQLKATTYKDRFPARWASYTARASAEVYHYSLRDWIQLHTRVFGPGFDVSIAEKLRVERQSGNEEDYGGAASKYGAGGEGKYHKELRLWVTAHPEAVSPGFARARTETEFGLDSGDRVDAVFHLKDRTVLVEVKSRISNLVDLRRGVFQCIKYRAVKIAMDVGETPKVEVILVTEAPIPGEIKALLRQHDIRHRQVTVAY